jgi:hypothetical protein
VLHPLLAVVVAIVVLGAARLATLHGPSRRTARLSTLLVSLVSIQVVAGVANVALLAPVWLQLVHLGVSDAAWITLVLLAVAALAEETRKPTAGPPPVPASGVTTRPFPGCRGGEAARAAPTLEDVRLDARESAVTFSTNNEASRVIRCGHRVGWCGRRGIVVTGNGRRS